MKIKFWDRVALFLGAILCIVTGGFVIYSGWMSPADTLLWKEIVLYAAGALSVLFGVYLFLFPGKFTYHKRDFIVQQTDNGELRIAVKAIENLVQKCIDMHEEIHVVSTKIHNGREGTTVDLCISLANNISIPLAVASLQKQIKQYLVASSGIDVREVRVSVETAQTGVGNSPYLVKADSQPHAAPAPAAAEMPKAKAKRPLHQRLFGKGDQKVTVPEPPKAEPVAEMPAEPAENAENMPQPVEVAPEAPEQAPAVEIPLPLTDEMPAPAQEEQPETEKENPAHE